MPSTGTYRYSTGTPPGENVPGTGRPKIRIDLPVPYSGIRCRYLKEYTGRYILTGT